MKLHTMYMPYNNIDKVKLYCHGYFSNSTYESLMVLHKISQIQSTRMGDKTAQMISQKDSITQRLQTDSGGQPIKKGY